MQRIIKFRAWDVMDNKIVSWEELINAYTTAWQLLRSHEQYLPMQFTGLKDNNGKEIYEGDILKYKPYNNFGHLKKYKVAEVKWGKTGDSDGWSHSKHYEWIVGDDSLADIADSDYPDEASCEVIGNTYENPELLKDFIDAKAK